MLPSFPVTISGVLIENIQDVYNFINEGDTIDYIGRTLPQIVDYFKTQYGAIGGNSVAYTTNKVTVSKISFNATFA